MNNRASRALRGVAFAAIATVTAAAAHTLGGGEPPSPLFCAILFALATPITTVLASPRPGPWRAAVAVGSGQILFHGAFALVGDLGSGFAATTALTGHVHDVATMSMADAAAPAHADMTLAHAVAALVTIVLVCRGEAALSAIAAWIVRVAVVPPTRPVFPGVPRRVDSAPATPRALPVVPPGLGRRGPPAPLLSLAAV